MSKSDTLEFNLLRSVFNGVPVSSLWATAGSTLLWLGLHTADPLDESSTATEGIGAQYTRIGTERSTGSSGWSVTSGTSAAKASAAPVSNRDFPQNTSTSTGTYTHASVWMSSAGGSSVCLYNGTITPNINVSQNVTPRLTTASSITEE